MALPRKFTQPISRTIFELNRRSVLKSYPNASTFPSSCDDNNYIKLAVSYLGLYVSSDDSPHEYVLDAMNMLSSFSFKGDCKVEVLLFSSLGHTLDALSKKYEGCIMSGFFQARLHIEGALRKVGSDEFYLMCRDIILKAQKAHLEVYNPAALIKKVLCKVSSASSAEKHESSETTMVDFEGLYQIMRKNALKEKKTQLAYANYIPPTSSDKTENEDSDFEWQSDASDVSEQAKARMLALGYTFETGKDNACEEVETYSKDGSEEAGTHGKDSYEEAGTYIRDGSDCDTKCMDVCKPASSEKTVVEVSHSVDDQLSYTSDEEEDRFNDFIGLLRFQQTMSLRYEDVNLDFPEVGMSATNEVTMDEGSSASANKEVDLPQYSIETAVKDFKDFTQFVIFEQLSRSEEAIDAKDRNADSYTRWGSTLLGKSLCSQSRAQAIENLKRAVSKLRKALRIDGNRMDTLCNASNAYAALALLTSGSSKSDSYKAKAKVCKTKAIKKDPAGCENLAWIVEELKASEKRKHGEAFDA